MPSSRLARISENLSTNLNPKIIAPHDSSTTTPPLTCESLPSSPTTTPNRYHIRILISRAILVREEAKLIISPLPDRTIIDKHNPINRNHGKGPRIPRPCRKGQVSDTKGTIFHFWDGLNVRWGVWIRGREPQQFTTSRWWKSWAERWGWGWRMIADGIISIGWASREEEDPQGPREEENHIHPPICQRYSHRWQEEGSYCPVSLPKTQSLTNNFVDEPQPNLISK